LVGGGANISTSTNIFSPLAFSIMCLALTLINNKGVWKGNIDTSSIQPWLSYQQAHFQRNFGMMRA
jgi:hypothetical protein